MRGPLISVPGDPCIPVSSSRLGPNHLSRLIPPTPSVGQSHRVIMDPSHSIFPLVAAHNYGALHVVRPDHQGLRCDGAAPSLPPPLFPTLQYKFLFSARPLLDIVQQPQLFPTIRVSDLLMSLQHGRLLNNAVC